MEGADGGVFCLPVRREAERPRATPHYAAPGRAFACEISKWTKAKSNRDGGCHSALNAFQGPVRLLPPPLTSDRTRPDPQWCEQAAAPPAKLRKSASPFADAPPRPRRTIAPQ